MAKIYKRQAGHDGGKEEEEEIEKSVEMKGGGRRKGDWSKGRVKGKERMRSMKE